MTAAREAVSRYLAVTNTVEHCEADSSEVPIAFAASWLGSAPVKKALREAVGDFVGGKVLLQTGQLLEGFAPVRAGSSYDMVVTLEFPAAARFRLNAEVRDDRGGLVCRLSGLLLMAEPQPPRG